MTTTRLLPGIVLCTFLLSSTGPFARGQETKSPRTLGTMSEADFITTKAHCLEIFQREVRRG